MMGRRQLLGSGAAGMLAAAAPRLAFAKAATERRFVFIIQRGAADGLAMLAPVGDPDFAALRGLGADQKGEAIDSFFALHPALGQTAFLYSQGDALFVHAVASSYRDRSHFDGQNVLETGGRAAYRLKDGWLNRFLGLLPAEEARALALSATVPMILRGGEHVSSYAPSNLPGASDDLLARVTAMYEGDGQLHPIWTRAVETRMQAGELARGDGSDGEAMGALAARLLGAAEGARVAVIETGGWDTHSGQAGRLLQPLRSLDAMLAALRAGLGEHWPDTLVLVATEFGRTARMNGTGGTDHGTGALAMLLGGAVKGGRIIADWPGLGASALHEGRDLRPTIDLEALIASILSQHYGLEPDRVWRTLFPEAAPSRVIDGLVRH